MRRRDSRRKATRAHQTALQAPANDGLRPSAARRPTSVGTFSERPRNSSVPLAAGGFKASGLTLRLRSGVPVRLRSAQGRSQHIPLRSSSWDEQNYRSAARRESKRAGSGQLAQRGLVAG